jgi:hypothetical protein
LRTATAASLIASAVSLTNAVVAATLSQAAMTVTHARTIQPIRPSMSAMADRMYLGPDDAGGDPSASARDVPVDGIGWASKLLALNCFLG